MAGITNTLRFENMIFIPSENKNYYQHPHEIEYTKFVLLDCLLTWIGGNEHCAVSNAFISFGKPIRKIALGRTI